MTLRPPAVPGSWRRCSDDLYEAEIAYLIEHEWARIGDNELWRRTKRGLHRRAIDAAALDAFTAQSVDRLVTAR